MDIGRTEITFVEPTGYNALLTPLGYGSTIGVWSTDVVLMYPTTTGKGWATGLNYGGLGAYDFVATETHPLPSWAEGKLGLLNRQVGQITFSVDAPVVVRMYNTYQWTNLPCCWPRVGWHRREDLEWCNAWGCGPTQSSTLVSWRVYERYFLAGTHELDTADAAYQFFTPADGTAPESDQPADLESAYIEIPAPTTYSTPKLNVSAPGYGTGLTPFDFGSSVDFWRNGIVLKRGEANNKGWYEESYPRTLDGRYYGSGFVATDAYPLPSWSEGALGLLSVSVGTITFTTDAPVIVRMFNTNRGLSWNDGNFGGIINENELWRVRFDLAWCNAWDCGPDNQESYVGSYWLAWERYFPEGTHTLDTTNMAYQFFTPADGTLPGSDQPVELSSADYIEIPAPTVYSTPKLNVSAPGYGTGLTPFDFGSSVDFWRNGIVLKRGEANNKGWYEESYPRTLDGRYYGSGFVATDAYPLPSWSEGALGLLSVSVGTITFTTDAPVIVRMFNTNRGLSWNDGNFGGIINENELWRVRFDLAWCNAWDCGPDNQGANVGNYWLAFERYFPQGTHTLDTTNTAYQFFTPADGTLPGSDQPAELASADYIEIPAPTVYSTPTVNVTNDYVVAPWEVNVTLTVSNGQLLNSAGFVATAADPLPSWSDGALGLLNVSVGTVSFTTDAPVIVRMFNTQRSVGYNDFYSYWPAIAGYELWRMRIDLAWCNAWKCAPDNQAGNVGNYWLLFERYFPEGTHTLDTANTAYQFFTPANGTLPGSEQPAALESAGS